MFGWGKKSKNKDFKAILEKKLCLARENPEPIFDLSQCGLKSVPSGVYSLCKVFRKEILLLQENQLSSLSNGGNLVELSFLEVLDLGHNQFSVLPDDIIHLVNLQELRVNNNCLKTLPQAISNLHKLVVLDVSHNCLQSLPPCIGQLKSLQSLNLMLNPSLIRLPQELCFLVNTLKSLRIDVHTIEHPPSEITSQGTQRILQYFCEELGSEYQPLGNDNNLEAISTSSSLQHVRREESNLLDVYKRLEIKKNKKLQELMLVEKEIHEQKSKEYILQNQNKQDKEKLLGDLLKQQTRLENEVEKFQNQKEVERNKLIDHLVKVEDRAGQVINELVKANNNIRTSNQWLKDEDEMQRAGLFNQQTTLSIQRTKILNEMETLLREECLRLQEYEKIKSSIVKSSLDREIEWDEHICAKVFEREGHQNAIVAAVAADEVAQKAAVGVLLERGDLYTQQLIAQVLLVEQQLAVVTAVEVQRKKLNSEQHLNDLAMKRVTLSNLLVDLLSQQEKRRHHILSTLKKMEEVNTEQSGKKSADFWLRQYQKIMGLRPKAISSAQKALDQDLVNELVLCGVVHCLPFVAICDLQKLTVTELAKVGLSSQEEQKAVLRAVMKYNKQKEAQNLPSAPPSVGANLQSKELVATIPSENRNDVSTEMDPQNSASAPPLADEDVQNECVICFERTSEGIFVPCGHLCTCMMCAVKLFECPLCRSTIERLIKVMKA
uniref:RING-type domain-containing protein n=1 Tax=Clastoptera arizonana TaxID=38151 RepID=A0A1B6CD26_9HEMI